MIHICRLRPPSEFCARSNVWINKGEIIFLLSNGPSYSQTFPAFSSCTACHGTRGKRNEWPKRKRRSEFLQIFTPQIQALVYLWLEKPNIARVMHSQSLCVLYWIPSVPKAAGMYAQDSSALLSVLQVTPGRARRLASPLTKPPATQEAGFSDTHRSPGNHRHIWITKETLEETVLGFYLTQELR